MSAKYFMHDENLYVVFPEGLADGRPAHVLGTWTETIDFIKRERFALINYPYKHITGTTYKIVKEGYRYSLEVNVVSGEELHVRLLDAEGEDPSYLSTLKKL